MRQKIRGWLAWDRSTGGNSLVGHRKTWRVQRFTDRWQRSLEALEPRTMLASDVMISEFLASNDTGLNDEDGESSDWLELFNAGREPVDLSGWHLTDDRADRTKWTIPANVALGPGESVVIFASGKDRATAGANLHTNFRISAGGEYLGLVQPDGRTVVSSFDPFPSQYADVSYGVSQELVDRQLLDAAAPARVLLPSSANEDLPASTWTGPDFDDSQWQARTTGLGYDTDPDDGDFSPLIHANGNLAGMQSKTASAYVRTEFNIPGDFVPRYKSITLTVNFDDGFVAYLNGQKIEQQNAPDTLAWDSTATQPNGGIGAVIRHQDLLSADTRSLFTLRGDAQWNERGLQLTAAAPDQTGAAWLTQPVAFGSDYTFSASMKFDIHSPGGALDSDGRGGEGLTFVLQTKDNNLLGTGGGGLGLQDTGAPFLAIELDSGNTGWNDPDTALGSHLGINTSSAGNLARVAIERFNGNAFFEGDPGPGQNFIYLWADYVGATKKLDVYVAKTDTKPDAPTLSAEIDLAELFAEVPDLWAGWTAATSAAWNGHEVVSWDIITGIGEIGRDPVDLDITQYYGALRPGKNVLAFHALNVSANDEDLLILPKLTAQEVVLGATNFFSQPSPGDVNGMAHDPPSGPVTFNITTQLFVNPLSVEIAGPPGAVIRYTIDGTIPDETSTEYTSPISVTETTRIRARAFQPNRSPGPVRSEGYLQVDASLAQFENGQPFSSNLPVMIFDNFGNSRARPDTNTLRLAPVTGVFINNNDANGRADLFDPPEFAGRAGLRSRGQSSEGWPKKQYALEIWDEGNDDTKTYYGGEVADISIPIFGLPSDSDWVLNGPYSDKTQLNNYLSFLWSNKAGLYAPRGKLIEVFVNDRGGPITYPRDYRGTFVLLEKIKSGNNRVDIDVVTRADKTEPNLTGGYIWKKDKSGANEQVFRTRRNPDLRMVEPQSPPGRGRPPGHDEILPEQLKWLTDYLNEFEDALFGPNFTDPKDGYAKYIDVDSWIDTWLLVETTKNIDGFRLSTYYYKDRNGKIFQGPAWDYNLALGNANYLQGGHPEGWYGKLISTEQYPYWDRLFSDPAFAQRVSERWEQLRKTVWSTENLLADVDEAVRALSDGNPNLEKPAAGEPSNPIARNFQKYRRLNVYDWPNCYFPGNWGDCPRESPLPGGRAPQVYADYIFLMKRFIELRMAWIDSQLIPPIRFTPDGGKVDTQTQVSITGPAGQDIYYTTDGSDPSASEVALVHTEHPVVTSPASFQLTVPTSNDMIDACEGFPRLADASKCFVNPDYVPGTMGETWINGTTPLGYDTDGSLAAAITTDVQDSVMGKNPSVYVRIPFTVDEALLAETTGVTLRTRHDDGFIAYLWQGTLGIPAEIARTNVIGAGRGTPIIAKNYNDTAASSRSDQEALEWQEYTSTSAKSWLRPGQNYLVLQLLNVSAGDNDFLFDAQLALLTTRREFPDAIRYTGPITVDRNTLITARAYDQESRDWTGAKRAMFIVNVPEVAITEVNYAPYDPTEAEKATNAAWRNDDFEFIEIQNTGQTPANLFNARLDGVTFTFPSMELAPGAYGVVVRDRAAFEARYGTNIPIFGEYGGQLDDNGEPITLFDPLGQEVFRLRFDDDDPWPQRPLTVGATLELATFQRGQAVYDQFTDWRASANFGGSPGAAGTAPLGVVISEVLSATSPPVRLTDSIELLNTTNAPVDLSGWYLSDSRDDFLKYRIPDGTVLGAGARIVLDESHFNADPNNPKSFALNALVGDDLWLTIPDGKGGIRSFVDDVHFLGAINGESFGRAPDATGRLVPNTDVTLGVPNSAPRVGPLVITELQYNPPAPSAAALAIDPNVNSNDLEYIEVFNPTDQTVSLEEWQIRGGVRFNFDPDLTLAPGGTIVVISFSPTNPDNASRLAALRAHYGLPDTVRLVGGYNGQLDGDAEVVQLLRPLESRPDDPNTIPRILEDEVAYHDRNPWPSAADGTGKSLQRLGNALYGNDAASWQAADPTPGRVDFTVRLPGDFNGDGTVQVDDIDLLWTQLRSPAPDSSFDLTGDGVVDVQDRDRLIQGVLGTTYGDANLDRRFDENDLLLIFQAGEYEDNVDGNSTWATGDFDGDGDFTTKDFVVAFKHGGYQGNMPQKPAAADALHGANDLASALDTPATGTRSRSASPLRTVLLADPEITLVARQRAVLLNQLPQDEDAVLRDQFFAEMSARDADDEPIEDQLLKTLVA